LNDITKIVKNVLKKTCFIVFRSLRFKIISIRCHWFVGVMVNQGLDDFQPASEKPFLFGAFC